MNRADRSLADTRLCGDVVHTRNRIGLGECLAELSAGIIEMQGATRDFGSNSA